MRNRSDEELVVDALAGQLDAYDELMRRYERLVFRVAYGFGRNRDNALDITQQVFFKAYRSLSTFRQNANLKTWLMTIAYNEGIDWVRRNGRFEDHEALEMEIGTNGSQEQSLLAREREELLRQEIGKLNERYRMAIGLRYQEGLPIAEIAAALHCSEGVVKNMLFRGLRTLRQALSPSLGGET